MRMTEYIIKKPPVTTKRTSVKVQPCTALLRELLICIYSYLKSVLIYKFLILYSPHPDMLYLREQVYEDPWLVFEAKRGRQAKKFGKH